MYTKPAKSKRIIRSNYRAMYGAPPPGFKDFDITTELGLRWAPQRNDPVVSFRILFYYTFCKFFKKNSCIGSADKNHNICADFQEHIRSPPATLHCLQSPKWLQTAPGFSWLLSTFAKQDF